MNEKRMFLRVFFMLITFGLIGLLGTLGRPSMANIRAVDIVHLIGTGMCFGGAIVALGARLRGRHCSEQQGPGAKISLPPLLATPSSTLVNHADGSGNEQIR